MKKFGLAVLLLVGALFAPRASQAQVAAYAEFSAGQFQNLVSDNILYGATTGILVDGPRFLKGHIVLGGDVEGRFEHKSNFNYDGVTVGARFYVPVKSFRPYAEFGTGFYRLYNPLDQSQPTTDATILINGGVMKKITPHIDAIAEFSYSQYYAFDGEYNPKTYSVGLAYYFAKR